MASRTVVTFIRDLKTSGLLSEKQQVALDKEVERLEDNADPAQVARQLVKQDWLTRWQAEMLMTGQTGLKVGHYHMLGILGRGGMGTVFRAKDTEKGREVAIKVMAKKLSKNETLVARFKREIEAVMSIESPHVVKAYDAGRIGRIMFMVMEVVDGRDIDSIVRKGKRLPAGIACELIRQAAIGLEAAHTRHMVHRDLKPSNLILTWPNATAPLVKIIDMGLVRSTRDVDNNGVTRDGQAMGTPDYMAPEQALDAKEADIRADIYSLGCTLFRMISGSVPFAGGNAVKILLERCQNEPPQLVDRVPDIDPRTNAIVLKMMARDPKDRYQTPREVAAALSIVADVPVEAELKGFMDDANLHAAKKTAMAIDNRLNHFLNELAGGEADLISASSYDIDGAAAEAVPTIAEFNTKTDGTERPKVKSNRGQVTAIAVCTLAFVAMLIGLRAYLEGGGATETEVLTNSTIGGDVEVIDSEPPQPAVVLVSGESYTVKAGEVLSFTMRPPEFLNADDQVVYTLDESTVEDVTIDPSTGQVQWTPDVDLVSGDQTLVFSARTPAGERIGEPVSVPISVTSSAPLRIESISDLTVEAGEMVQFQIPFSGRGSSKDLKLRLESASVPNPRSLLKQREFKWQTTAKNVGTHSFWIKLVNDVDEVLSEQRFMITVNGPRSIRLPAQVATVGQEFLLRPNIRLRQLVGTNAKLKLTSGPDGLSLTNNRISWTPIPSEIGRHVVEAEIIRKDNQQMLGTVSFVVKVNGAQSDRSSVPDEKQLIAAREKIDELFKREIAAARTLPTRRELSRKLFDRAIEMEPGAQSYALLDLSREMAVRGRDYPAAIDCVRELQSDFDVDGLAILLDSLGAMRTRDLESTDRILMPEVLFSFLQPAVKSEKYELADDLIKHLRSIATAERSAELKALVSRVSELLDGIQGTENKPAEPDAAELAKNELEELLLKMNFMDVFDNKEQFGFLDHLSGDIDDRGRSLWNIDNGRITVRSDDVPVSTGFIDVPQQGENYVLRIDMASDSNSGKLIFGVTEKSGQVEAFEIGLSNTNFGVVRKTGSADVIARPVASISRSPTGWDHVELEVQGDKIALRFNNRTIVETALGRSATGSIGLDVQLGNAESLLRLRNARVRTLTGG